MPHPPRLPPVPAGENWRALDSQIDSVPLGYASIHAPLPNAQSFYLDVYAQDSKHDKKFVADLLTDEGTSTG